MVLLKFLMHDRFLLLQALQMAYFSNKPAPSPGHLLPRPGFNAAVIKEPELRPNLKRKLKDSESGIYIIYLFTIHIDFDLKGTYAKYY